VNGKRQLSNELLLHPLEHGSRRLQALYRHAFAEAEELYVLSAYLRKWDKTLKLNKHSQAIMPRHEGIRIAALANTEDTGFLLVDVERSERRPHRCEFGDKQYFIDQAE
jgi:hypothetical protein